MLNKMKFAFVCLSVCPLSKQNISKNIEPINFIYGGGLPSDPGRNQSILKKNCPGVRMGVGGPKCGLK